MEKDNIKTSIGIMGGTFNPIHYGHLVTAEQSRKIFNLDRVIFVPSGRPPHKKNNIIIDCEHRYLMTVLATSTNPYFTVSKVEIERAGSSYTVDTIKHFSSLYANEADIIYFITGADAILEILTWKNSDELLDLSHIIAATRPGYDVTKLKKVVGKQKMENIHLLEIPALAISSTDIRHRISNNLSIKYLLPEAVEGYIEKNRLYQIAQSEK